MRQALQDTSRAHLERFFKYVLKYPGNYFGREWKVADIYATWLLFGARDE